MAARNSHSRFVLITKVRPGQRFRQYGADYIRATEEEEKKHPGIALAAERQVVMAYAWNQEAGKRVPVTFVPTIQVIVERMLNHG